MAVLRKYGLLDAVWLRLYCGLTRRNVFGRSHVRSESPPFPPSSRALVSFALVLLLHKSSVYNGHHVQHGARRAARRLAPRIKTRRPTPGETRGEADGQSQAVGEVEWVDMYEEGDVFAGATCAISVAALICAVAMYWVFSSIAMPHEVENGVVGK